MIKKIYYIANVRFPSEKAHAIQIAKMCEAYLDLGIDIKLVIPRGRNRINDKPRHYYGLSRDIPLIRLPAISSIFGFNIRALSFCLTSFFFAIFIRNKKETVLYTIDLDQFSYFLLPFARMPVFAELHGSKKKSVFLNIFFKSVTGIIAVSKATMETLKKDYSVKKIIVESNGVDPSFFGREKSALSETPLVLYVGRIYDWKGLGAFVRAARYLEGITRFNLIGGTKDELAKCTGEDKLPANLSIVEPVPLSEVPLWLAKADVLVLTATKKSKYSYEETSPMKLYEYMASMRPIIAAEVPSVMFMTNKEEVFFYKPDDGESLAERVQFVLAHKKVAMDKVRRAAKRAEDMTWEKRAQRILDFINKIIMQINE